jgi:hypothetical protein
VESLHGYSVICLNCVALILIITMLILAGYVVASFVRRDFRNGLTPVRVLRTLGTMNIVKYRPKFIKPNHIVSFLSSVLFLPIMFSLFNIFYFESSDTSKVTNAIVISLRVASGIAIPIFLTFTYIMSMTYFNPNPLSTALSARPSSRLELIEITCKILLTATAVFAKDRPIARSIIVMICFFSIYLFMWINIP